MEKNSDPGWKKIRIRNSRWKKFGSGINIQDLQHCPLSHSKSKQDPDTYKTLLRSREGFALKKEILQFITIARFVFQYCIETASL
jgi:hypothetical protein